MNIDPNTVHPLDRAVFELTPAERARAEAQFERELEQLGDADPELRAQVIESHRRTMAMTWQERMARMTSEADDVEVEK